MDRELLNWIYDQDKEVWMCPCCGEPGEPNYIYCPWCGCIIEGVDVWLST